TKVVLDDLKHAGEFTKIENTAIVYVLRGWFGSVSAIPGALEAGDDASSSLMRSWSSRRENLKPFGLASWSLVEPPTSRLGSGLSMLGRVSAPRAATWNMLDSCSRAQQPPDSMMAQCSNFAPASYSTYCRYRMIVGLSATNLTCRSIFPKPIATP